MDSGTDTLSGRFGGQWAFLSNPPHHGQPRSLPPSSSYLRSDPSSVSPLPNGAHFQHFNASRSSLPRNLQTPSVGGHSSLTIPSQPVLLRVHSADASAHLHPAPRPSRRMNRNNNELPSIQEFSIQGILAAIQEDIEDDIDAISEILGRSRLVLADQHDSHLPPQGIIRATSSPLQAVEEASSSNERLAADEVLILQEDASLVEGSHTGSAAYGLLERLQAVPRNRRMRSELTTSPTTPVAPHPARHSSSPAILTDNPSASDMPTDLITQYPARPWRHLLDSSHSHQSEDSIPSRATNAVVSEIYLSAGANGHAVSDPPRVSEAGREYPLYSYDESEIFAGTNLNPSSSRTFRARLQTLLRTSDFTGLIRRAQTDNKQNTGEASPSAERQLRDILQRQQQRAVSLHEEEQEEENGYD